MISYSFEEQYVLLTMGQQILGPVIDRFMILCLKTSVFRTNLRKVTKILNRNQKKLKIVSIHIVLKRARKLLCATISTNLNKQNHF